MLALRRVEQEPDFEPLLSALASFRFDSRSKITMHLGVARLLGVMAAQSWSHSPSDFDFMATGIGIKVVLRERLSRVVKGLRAAVAHNQPSGVLIVAAHLQHDTWDAPDLGVPVHVLHVITDFGHTQTTEH